LKFFEFYAEDELLAENSHGEDGAGAKDGTVKGYEFEPRYTEEEMAQRRREEEVASLAAIVNQVEETRNHDDIAPDSVPDKDWADCTCFKCHRASGMPLVSVEKGCCRGTPFARFTEDGVTYTCITDHPNFTDGVLNKSALRLAAIRDNYRPPSRPNKG
jgi:hypothetical protein